VESVDRSGRGNLPLRRVITGRSPTGRPGSQVSDKAHNVLSHRSSGGHSRACRHVLVLMIDAGGRRNHDGDGWVRRKRRQVPTARAML